MCDAVRHVDTFKRSVGDVELVEEREVLGLAGDGFRLVESVITDGLAELLPVQVDATTGTLSKSVVAVDARLAIESVRLIRDIEQREAGKLDARVVRRARLDVGRKEGPSVGLRKTGLKPVTARVRLAREKKSCSESGILRTHHSSIAGKPWNWRKIIC